jgi:hypothetical protein
MYCSFNVQFGEPRDQSHIKVVINRNMCESSTFAVGLDDNHRLMIADVDALGIDVQPGDSITNKLGDTMHDIIVVSGKSAALGRQLLIALDRYQMASERRHRESMIGLIMHAYDSGRKSYVLDSHVYTDSVTTLAVEAMSSGAYWQLARNLALSFVNCETVTYHGMPATKLTEGCSPSK